MLRFRLRTLLIVVGVLSIGLATIVAPLLRHRREHAREMEIVAPLHQLPHTLTILSTPRGNWPAMSAALVGSGPEIFKRVDDIRLIDDVSFWSARQPAGNPRRVPPIRNLSSELFDRLPELEYLDTLCIDNCALTAHHLEVFARCRLRFLNFDYCQVDAQPLAIEHRFQHLELLVLEHCEPGVGSVLERIGHCPKLTKIVFLSCNLTQIDFDLLANIPSLEDLQLINTPFTQLGLKSLTRLQRLRSLNLEETDVDPAAMAIVANYPTLELLTISARAITPDSAIALTKNAKLKVGLTGSEVDKVDQEAHKILRESGHALW